MLIVIFVTTLFVNLYYIFVFKCLSEIIKYNLQPRISQDINVINIIFGYNVYVCVHVYAHAHCIYTSNGLKNISYFIKSFTAWLLGNIQMSSCNSKSLCMSPVGTIA